MKKILSLLAAFGVMFTISSCGDDDDPSADNGVTITGIPAVAEIDNLGTYTATATIEAKDGLAALTVTKNGGTFAAEVYTGETSTSYTFTYTAAADEADANITFAFNATDNDGDTETATLVLSVGDAPAPVVNQVLSGKISSDMTLTADRVWELSGKVVVDAGVTLTIEPGTIIKGRKGEGSLASALIVAQGGKIMAEGTAQKPIVFTSELDNIGVGQSMGTSLDETDRGLWGGVIILGKAPISADAEAVQIEGIPADEAFGKYGGTIADDNSGTFKYVSIRHGGSLIGEGNEINGLTLGGVGSATTIEFIEVVGNNDDGIEWFGGTVNVTNALVWSQADDAFDIDQAYAGTIDNIVYIAGDESDHALEIDGAEGTTNASFTMMNGSFKGTGDKEAEYADFRDGAMGTVKDLYFFGFHPKADVELDADGSVDPADNTKKLSNNPATSDNYKGGSLIITGLEFSNKAADDSEVVIGSIFADKWKLAPSTESFDPTDSRSDSDATTQAAANKTTFNTNNTVVSSATVGADMTKFDWTYAKAKGALTGF